MISNFFFFLIVRTLVFGTNAMFFGGVADDEGIIQRVGQLSTVDFVGCIRSISINGNEKDLVSEAINSTGLTDTCNYVEGGPCSDKSICGEHGMDSYLLI